MFVYYSNQSSIKKSNIMKKTVFILGIAVMALGFYSFAHNESKHSHASHSKSYVISSAKETLLNAIVGGDLEAVKLLVDAGVDVNKKINGKTPLMYAARYNQVGIVKYLIDNGAKVNLKCKNGYTALKYAEFSKAFDTQKYLKEIKS